MSKSKTRKLGRGLDSLIQPSAANTPAAQTNGDETRLPVQELDPRQISVNRDQPRQRFDNEQLKELAESIRHHGIVQPLVVRRNPSGDFELIAGERRLRAALSLGLPTVPVVLRKVDESRLLDLALVENIQREDLNPIELAVAYAKLKEVRGWTQAELAAHLGKKRSSVANVLRYLDLPDVIRNSLEVGALTEGHVKLLLSLDRAEDQFDLHQEILDEQLTVRDLEERVRARRTHARKKPGAKRPVTAPGEKDPEIIRLEGELSTRLGTRCRIEAGARTKRGQKGRIIVEYFSGEEFERLYRHISK